MDIVKARAEYLGYKIVESTAITKEVQRRTHKKKRINKKWAKRYGYKAVPDNCRFVLWKNYIFAQPELCDKFVEAIQKQDEDNRKLYKLHCLGEWDDRKENNDG